MALSNNTGDLIILLKIRLLTSLQDLLSIHGAAQMEETLHLCKKVVPDAHLKQILVIQLNWCNLCLDFSPEFV